MIFLRNDIYELLLEKTPDRGKQTRVLIDWNQPDLATKTSATSANVRCGWAVTTSRPLAARIRAIVIFASLKRSCDQLSIGFASAARRQREIIIIGCTRSQACARGWST